MTKKAMYYRMEVIVNDAVDYLLVIVQRLVVKARRLKLHVPLELLLSSWVDQCSPRAV